MDLRQFFMQCKMSCLGFINGTGSRSESAAALDAIPFALLLTQVECAPIQCRQMVMPLPVVCQVQLIGIVRGQLTHELPQLGEATFHP